jgi:hypothetical protein
MVTETGLGGEPSRGVFHSASSSWGKPAQPFLSILQPLRERLDALSEGLRFVDRSDRYSRLVSANELRDRPIHRWYYYKEGFSPRLPRMLVEELGAGSSQTVVDSFAGVGTTPLSLLRNPKVRRSIAVEYSPFAAFVGATKLRSLNLDGKRLSEQIPPLLAHTRLRPPGEPPALAAFRNPAVFDAEVLQSLLRIRDQLHDDASISTDERAFFLLGLAAIVEDVSGVMKDGRALRILRDRKRHRLGLTPTLGGVPADDVYSAVSNQWNAMVEDLACHKEMPIAEALQLRGDARNLTSLTTESGERVIPDDSVGLYLYSPPYLNCIDYSEVYKLELWLLKMVQDQRSFRELREGTIRSHPSITFPLRPQLHADTAEVFSVVKEITNFLVDNLSRPEFGVMHGDYFADMHEVLEQQFQTLEPGGSIACVVANSTFSRRLKIDGERVELWRVPVLTDVVLARIAEAVGFEQVEIWIARHLRAKNVNDGQARESILVARKPKA